MSGDALPRHVGIIMDGNGRWAQRRLMPRAAGHRAGMNAMIKIADCARERGIEYLTVYALSTENLARPKDELDSLYELFRGYFTENVRKLYAKGCAVRAIGDFSALPEDIARLLVSAEADSPADAAFTMVFAVNYGGRCEIVSAVNRAVEGGRAVSAEEFSSLLYTRDLPEPDLIIRTGGELRISNFLIWQAAYSELYFTKTLFPDFGARDLDKALKSYASRDRRYGRLNAE